MNRIFKGSFILILYGSLLQPLMGQTIEEKKASLVSGNSGDLSKEMQRFLFQVNNELKEQYSLLKELYGDARILYQNGASDFNYQELLVQINQVKDNIKILQESWQKMASENSHEEGYALWHLPDTTIGQLVIDYGSQEYVYLIPEEIEEIPLSVNSNIPIPRSEWNEMLHLILQQNGIGIRQLTPLLRELYLFESDNSGIEAITNQPEDLNIFPNEARICFVLSPKIEEVKRVWFFLEKFINPNSSELQMIGQDILIIAPVREVKELLKLFYFVENNGGKLDYKVVPLHRVDPTEMANVLSSIFEQFSENANTAVVGQEGNKSNASTKPQNVNGLKVLTLSNMAQAIFLIGTPEEINKALDIIDQVESEVGVAREKVVYTYQTKHTDSAELADILDRVYFMMVQSGVGIIDEENVNSENLNETNNVNNNQNHVDVVENPNLLAPEQVYNPGYYHDGSYVINSDLIQPGSAPQGNPDPNGNRSNFIVDVKTGSIVMVVESIFLPKLKELIRKLDVPKKAVQIEVLLFEKQVDKESLFGLNLLRIGDSASNVNSTSLSFNNINPVEGPPNIGNRGILDFFISRAETSSSPAFDIAYKFLLTRDDITINSNPSVVAINQTTATIEVKDQISLNTGTLLIGTTNGAIPSQQFVREEYGITIKVTPTIHMRDDFGPGCIGFDEKNYITLQSDITFDTIRPSVVDRPDVTRRHIVNETRIADGQTVIIGGLRRKESRDLKESIPFLGELPGIGKLFSETRLEDSSREMFIFITPSIIVDPAEDMERLKYEHLSRRPGDIPAFLCRLDRAREREKNKLFEGYLTMILGREPAPLYCPPGVYDGRCR